MASVQSNAESSGRGDSSRPQGKLPWFGPVLLLVGAVFLQNAGLYGATCSYVRWMDEFIEAEQRSHGGPSVVEDVVLIDPLADWLVSWRMPPIPDVPWRPEVWAEGLTAIVSLVWLGWVARAKDLQLWTKVMLSGAVLAALKGFLAWATVLPDSAGWHGCRIRLGEDGLAYFREVAAGGAHGGGPSLGSLQSVQDVAMLSISSMWMMGRLGRQRVCADTVFATPTCFSLLLSMGVYDLARSSTQDSEAVRRSTVRSIVGLTLGLVLVVHLVLTLLSPDHYALDVAVAFPLTLLVYTNPVIAVASKRWMDEWAVEFWSAVVNTPSVSLASATSMLVEAPCSPPAEADSADAVFSDVGEATVPPCCLPFCSMGGHFHLRGQPGSPAYRPWTPECERCYQQNLAEFREVRSGFQIRQRRFKEDIERESRRIQEREVELRESCDRRIAEERKRVQERESAVLSEAGERLHGERKAAMGAEEKAIEIQRRLDADLASLGETWGKLSEEVEEFKRQADEAWAACKQHQQGLEEVLRRADGDTAAAVEEEKQVEALMAFPQPVKESNANGDAHEEPAPTAEAEPAGADAREGEELVPKPAG